MAENDLIKVKGIVTRAVQYKDNDKIISLLTAEYGLISVYCHGARSNKSKYLTSTRLFCYSEFVLTRKKDFYYIKEADYIEAFFDIVNSMDKLFLGQYFLEVVNEICVEGERQDGVLRLLLNSLYALSADLFPPTKIKSAFELRACVEMGVGPNVSLCRNCGTVGEEVYYFDLVNGDMLCKDCLMSYEEAQKYTYEAESMGTYIAVVPSVAVAMQYVTNTKVERLFSFALGEEAFRDFSNICEKYLLHQVGKSFVTLDLYNEQIKN